MVYPELCVWGGILLCKILWKGHCACQSSLEFCSSNKSIQWRYVSLLTWHVQHGSEGDSVSTATQPPFPDLWGSKEEEKLGHFTWALPCSSEGITMATSAHMSLVGSSHTMLPSWKENKCDSLGTGKEKRTKYQSTLAMLTTSTLCPSNDCFAIVPTQRVLICLPAVETPKSHWFIASMSTPGGRQGHQWQFLY